MKIISKVGRMFIVKQDIEVLGITIPKGFVSDGATIPQSLKPIFKEEEDKYLIPAILHDYMYYKQMGFIKSNIHFYRALKLYKVKPVVCELFFTAVSIFGFKYYINRNKI